MKKPKYLTLDEALDVVEAICGEAECEGLQGGEFIPTAKTMLAGQIYKIVHAHRKKCGNPHTDWLLKWTDYKDYWD